MGKIKTQVMYEIKISEAERNGMHLLAARLDMSFSNVVNLALDAYLRQKLTKQEYELLRDLDFVNQRIGEAVNGNRGIFGYEPSVNPVPSSKKHYFIQYEDFYEQKPVSYEDLKDVKNAANRANTK